MQASGLPTIQPDFCPTVSRQYLRYRAKLSLRKSAIVEHDNKEVLTSVAAMPYGNHTVLFIGTAQGRLLKVCRVDRFFGKFGRNIPGVMTDKIVLGNFDIENTANPQRSTCP